MMPTTSWANDIRVRYTCRVCASTRLTPFCDLGVQPLANAFLHREDVGLPEFRAPLKVQVCDNCGLSQLTHVVAPERLYSHYLFYSGVSASWRAHCDRLAAELLQLYSSPFVVDIASNDGSLLLPFKQRGAKVLGIEPAQNITQSVAVPTLAAFWSADTARHVRDANGPASAISSNSPSRPSFVVVRMTTAHGGILPGSRVVSSRERIAPRNR